MNRAAIGTILVQGVELSAQLAAGIVVARGFGPEGLGTWSLALGLVGTAAIVLQPGIVDTILQLALEGIDRRALLGVGLARLPRGLARVLAVLVIAAVVADASIETVLAMGIAMGTLTLNAVASLLGAVVIAEGRSPRDLPGAMVSRALLVAVVAVGALLDALPIALAGGVVAGLGLSVWRLWLVRDVAWPPRRDDVVDALVTSSSRRLGIGVAAGALSARADLVVLHRVASASALGLYAAAARITSGLLALAQAVALATHPALSRGLAQKDPTAWRRFATPAVLLVVGMWLAAATHASRGLTVLFGASFVDAAPVLDVLLVAGSFQVTNTFLARALLARGRAGVLMPVQLVLAVVGPVLQAAGVTMAGAAGSALATCTFEAILLVASVVAVLRPDPSPKRSTSMGVRTPLGQSNELPHAS